jgi:hypothetical protein
MSTTPKILSSRRDVLRYTACGFGNLALMSLMSQHGLASPTGSAATARGKNPLGARVGHHPAKAKRVIFLFMQGGPSHVDSYDYKPALIKHADQQMPFDNYRKQANTGERGSMERVMGPHWQFQKYGECGRWASELFPHTAAMADDLTFIHSMHTEGVSHGPATLFLHCGSTAQVRPSMGSWITFGLGSENENLPGFVTINPSPGNGGARNYGNAFLPAVYQGTALGKAGDPIEKTTIRNLGNAQFTLEDQKRQLDLIQQLNAEQMKGHAGETEMDAIVNSYELAWRMQNSAPDALDLTHESPQTLAMYGIGEKETDTYGRQCLMARRLAEQGVRYIQVTYGDSSANPKWDQHSNLPKHMDHARATDKPVAGLLADLKQRGLLEDTIVWWGGEFGRTPYAERNGTGRDHNPGGFTVWVAGGGFKPGIAYGQTDEFGHHAVQDKVHMHDLHASILWLLGLDHEKLTYRYAGRDFRLTDVYGHVVRELFA